jgi:hypothetical protein
MQRLQEQWKECFVERKSQITEGHDPDRFISYEQILEQVELDRDTGGFGRFQLILVTEHDLFTPPRFEHFIFSTFLDF